MFWMLHCSLRRVDALCFVNSCKLTDSSICSSFECSILRSFDHYMLLLLHKRMGDVIPNCFSKYISSTWRCHHSDSRPDRVRLVSHVLRILPWSIIWGLLDSWSRSLIWCCLKAHPNFFTRQHLLEYIEGVGCFLKTADLMYWMGLLSPSLYPENFTP